MKTHIGIVISVVGFVLFSIGLFNALEDFGLVVRVTDEYFANPQNVTTIIDISTQVIPNLIKGMVISVIIGAFISAILGYLKLFS